MTIERHVTTDEIMFRDPDVDPPPRGVGILMLNPGGVLVVGAWEKTAVAWCPKPKVPDSVKAKLWDRYMGLE